MHVHVPEAGDQEKVSAVDHMSVTRILGGHARSDECNLIVLNDDRLIGQELAGSNVYNRHIVQNKQGVRRGLLCKRERRRKKECQQESGKPNGKAPEAIHAPRL
jgi:hypothetical protein